jgi:hypothetical protein
MDARIGKDAVSGEWEVRVYSDNRVTTGWGTGRLGAHSLVRAEDSWHLVQFAESLLKAAQAIQGYEWVNDEITKEN